MLVVLLVLRPPVLHPRQGDRAALLDILPADPVGAGGRAGPPVVAGFKVRSEFLVEILLERRQAREALRHRLGGGQPDADVVVAVGRDPPVLLAVIGAVERLGQVGREVDVKRHQPVPRRHVLAVGPAGILIDVEIHRLAVRIDRPLVGQRRDRLAGARVPGGQRHLDIVPVIAAERVVPLLAQRPDRRRIGPPGDEGMKGPALFRVGRPDLRLVEIRFPNQIRWQVGLGQDVEELRALHPVPQRAQFLLLLRPDGILQLPRQILFQLVPAARQFFQHLRVLALVEREAFLGVVIRRELLRAVLAGKRGEGGDGRDQDGERAGHW